MRNVPRLWDLKGGYQHCENLLMVLSLDNFLQVCAQLSTGKTISVVFRGKEEAKRTCSDMRRSGRAGRDQGIMA